MSPNGGRVTLGLGTYGREAVAAALVLARRPYDLTPASTLTSLTGSSPARLRGALAALRRAGLVEAAPGAGGGYRLSRPPRDVSLLDVVAAAGGDLRTRTCLQWGSTCDGSCSAHPAWAAAQDALRDSLAACPLSRVAEP
jgi:Rrf2 family protein